jgi:hypothetical protein
MMKMIFKNMVMTKKLKLTLDYHMYLLWLKNLPQKH